LKRDSFPLLLIGIAMVGYAVIFWQVF